MEKIRAPRNRTITISQDEREYYSKNLKLINENVNVDQIIGRTIVGNTIEIVDFLPNAFVDLLIIDPPYNITKNFHGLKFAKTDDDAYYEYLASWFSRTLRLVKPNGSVYIKQTQPLCVFAMGSGTVNRISIEYEQSMNTSLEMKWDGDIQSYWKTSLNVGFWWRAWIET